MAVRFNTAQPRRHSNSPGESQGSRKFNVATWSTVSLQAKSCRGRRISAKFHSNTVRRARSPTRINNAIYESQKGHTTHLETHWFSRLSEWSCLVRAIVCLMTFVRRFLTKRVSKHTATRRESPSFEQSTISILAIRRQAETAI